MMQDITVKIVSSDKDYRQAMDVRRAVFVEECKIPEKDEFDGNDHSSTHILALCDSVPVGTMRIRYFNGFVKFERMCVLPAYRKTDVSETIMREGMQFAAQKGYQTVYGVCKKELLERWKRSGFDKVLGVDPVEQNGMTLVPIYCTLPLSPNAITMQTPLHILNAKEGDWDVYFAENAQQKRWHDISRKMQHLVKDIRRLKEQVSESPSGPIIKRPPSRGRDD